MTTASRAASIRTRLSQHREQFLLKGALLFDLWFDVPSRPTRDIDLLGFGSEDMDELADVIRDVCAIPADDGVVFDPSSVRATEIRKQARYPGIRVKLQGRLDGALCSVQVDVGFGDAVTPGPIAATFPVLLPDIAAPNLQVYPVYTVVAEKLEAIITLGMANSTGSTRHFMAVRHPARPNR